jgi:DNA invertase Pin-like site-specific DNA recombinase
MQRIDPTTAERIRKLREQGKSVREAAAIVGVSHGTVGNYGAIQFSESHAYRCKRCGARVKTVPCMACTVRRNEQRDE